MQSTTCTRPTTHDVSRMDPERPRERDAPRAPFETLDAVHEQRGVRLVHREARARGMHARRGRERSRRRCGGAARAAAGGVGLLPLTAAVAGMRQRLQAFGAPACLLCTQTRAKASRCAAAAVTRISSWNSVLFGAWNVLRLGRGSNLESRAQLASARASNIRPRSSNISKCKTPPGARGARTRSRPRAWRCGARHR